MFGISSFFHTFRALFKKNWMGGPKGGDVRQMPGIFLIVKEEIVWHFSYEAGIGELPDWQKVPRIAE